MPSGLVGSIKKVATLGGRIPVNRGVLWMYGMGNNSNFTKEKLFGMSGPLHFCMPCERERMAVESVSSDTSKDLMGELQEKGLTREEARITISDLLKAGILTEVYDPELKQKVLVLRG